MSGRDEKSRRYIALLDTARANGNWNELPELIRKLTKHAPERKCLIETATTEYEIIQHISTSGRRKQGGNEAVTNLKTRYSNLENLRKSTDQNSEEYIQAIASLLWTEFIGVQVRDDTDVFLSIDSSTLLTRKVSIWTKICLIKSAYMRGMLLTRSNKLDEAEDLFTSVLPWISANRSQVVSAPQLLYWSQQLLSQNTLHNKGNADYADVKSKSPLHAFREWAILSAKARDVPASTYGDVSNRNSKLSIWRTYYYYLSNLVQNGISTDDSSATKGRGAQIIELRKVETSYENELLKKTQFPKASETNEIIEEWVEQVIRNWQVLCGSRWTEAELGEGGRNSVGRNVLDILYRAAMKTFHSTLILRRLFQVHKSLADFDLAYNALDTYLELIERGRERNAKSDKPSNDQDDDPTVLRTISEGIEGLCTFGGHREAERAFTLCSKLEDLLKNLVPELSRETANGDIVTRSQLSSETLCIVHRALGIGKAHWAIWTPFSERRNILQSEAIASLELATSQQVSHDQRLESIYPLCLLLAETREINEAIDLVKQTLSQFSSYDENDSSCMLQRKLIPFWHLMGLLLSARQDFDTAGQSCGAAFDQFPESDTLLGRATSIDELSEKQGDTRLGLAGEMECDELQRIIEVSITELALTELLEGPEQAVNSSNDILSLYHRLFGHLGTTIEDRVTPKRLEPPKSSAGTVKSYKGSFFSRRKNYRSSGSYVERPNGTASTITDTTRPPTTATQAPTIQITNEDDKTVSRHKHHKFHHPGPHLSTKPSIQPSSEGLNSQLSTSHEHELESQVSSQRQSFETTLEKPASSIGSVETAQPHFGTKPAAEDVPASPVDGDHASSPQAKQPLKEIPHNLASHEEVPPPVQHSTQPPQQDVRLPSLPSPSIATWPIPRFPKLSAQKYALTVLVKIWLIIATLYRRAHMFDDSREACDEAAKASSKFEALVAGIESSARSFAETGWGGTGKSSDELWADVYCERAELSLAIAKLREEKDREIDNAGVREAVEQYERCLMYFANHPGGIVGLSNVLLDYYERKVELAYKIDNGISMLASTSTKLANKSPIAHRPHEPITTNSSTQLNGTIEPNQRPSSLNNGTPSTTQSTINNQTDDDLKKTPENLNRLAARDRAYGLLSTLTKLGSGWDYAEAWYALARAHELGGEVDKARDILWWCVELEDTRPIRHWRNLSSRGYVL